MDDKYFTVTPMSQRFEAMMPGQTYEGSITVINPVEAKEDFNYSVSVAPYGVKGTEYSADLLTDSNHTMITDWITVDEPVGVLKPNATKEIHFKIQVPENAPAGGQYAAIVIGEDHNAKSEENLMINNVLEIASLIYSDVNGETKREGKVLENNIPSFVTGAPITVSALISNDGNIHETATIIIEATNFFTGEVIVKPEGAKDYYTELIMPETTRMIQRDISENLPALGVIHVEQTIYYNGEETKEAKNVIICPVWFMLLTLAVIVIIIVVIVGIIRKHHKAKAEQYVV